MRPWRVRGRGLGVYRRASLWLRLISRRKGKEEEEEEEKEVGGGRRRWTEEETGIVKEAGNVGVHGYRHASVCVCVCSCVRVSM